MQQGQQEESKELARQKEEAQKIADTLGDLKQQEADVLNAKAAIERKITAAGSEGGVKSDLARLKAEYEAVSSQYKALQAKINDNSGTLSRRADRILLLEESLAKKDQSLVRIKSDMKARHKELADLRENMVKVKLDNARLKKSLAQKEKAFQALKEDLGDINKVNARFGDSLTRANQAFGVGSESEAEERDDKQTVDVEIESISQVQGNNR